MTNPNTPRAAPARVNTSEDADIRYWSKKLGVAREEFLAAVEVAGTRIDHIAEHLSKESASGPSS